MSPTLSPEELEKKADSYYKKSGSFFSRLLSQVDLPHAADLYIQAAQAYGNASNYTKSAELFYKAAEILFGDGKEESMYESSSAFVKAAEAYYIVDKDMCTVAYGRAFDVATMHIRDFSMAAILAVKTAKSFLELKKDTTALEYLYKAASLYGQAKMCINRRNILVQCAELEMRRKNYEKAFELYKELSEDNSALGQVIEKTSFFFCAILCGIIVGRTDECSAIMNQMDETRIETKIIYQMMRTKTTSQAASDELEKNITYFRKTHKVSPEVISALQDVQMSIDPNNDIL
ncbi:hypothetical protein NEHOM01_1811 [Nematocida homosporus]|uniref:uncharacterized protein n=1 Tax=Nematocida homosporus TaxID=1912981 RepID=UPI00221FB071|nr:uncharacterized protein NEHOM01_1811 [Nematocida homosporus]KAI5186945.1 hypothetical protein NEHOM01_1811 [Nematocida homosporus]